jgi:hypothetical protein
MDEGSAKAGEHAERLANRARIFSGTILELP